MFVDKNRVIAVMGPTASGKTELAFYLSELIPVEIISVDSALVYRDMNIGSAKPNAADLARIPHHLVDIRDPRQSYSAAEFRRDALVLIRSIHARGRVPLMVGGTMLYYRSLFKGLSDLPKADPKVRAALDAEAASVGWAAMHAQLGDIDPIAAARINPNDPQRIQRAIEVYRISGHTMTELCKDQPEDPFPFSCNKVVLAPDNRQCLHQRIEQRFHKMLKAGFIAEVEALRARGDLDLDMPAIRAVGYRQAWEYLDGLYSYDEMIARGLAATRQLAKRQFTWLRKEPDAVWFDSEQAGVYKEVVDYFKSI